MTAKELFEQAQELFIKGNTNESIGFFNKALDAGYDAFMIHLSRGVAYLRLEVLDKAAEDFSRAVALKIDNPRAYFYRGMAALMSGKNEAALLDFNKALDLKEGFSLALLARSTALSRLNRIDEAAADIRKLVPHLDSNLQSFVDTYGLVRTEMWKVMAEATGEAPRKAIEMTPEEIAKLKKFLGEA
jgi:tetratricopeptide (TPR) repeat protein